MLKAVLRLQAVLGSILSYIFDCHLKTNMLLTCFAVNHSDMSLGVNASHETPDVWPRYTNVMKLPSQKCEIVIDGQHSCSAELFEA